MSAAYIVFSVIIVGLFLLVGIEHLIYKYKRKRSANKTRYYWE